MIEYNKIETIFERDISGTKKLIEGKFRNETVEFLKNIEWEFTEKIDGTNIRIFWDGHKVSYGGRTDSASIPAHLMNYLVSKFGTNEAEELFEQMFGEREVILFGEGYGPKIQKGGGLYRDDVSFIMFDVMIGSNYQSRDSVNSIASAFDVDSVPVLFTGELQKGVNFVKTNPPSTINSQHEMEGVVARPKIELRDRCGNRVIVKIKVKDFR